MAGKASKDKGKAGERELAKILGEALDGNFERVPFSGAMIGGKNFIRKERMTEDQIRVSKADLIPPEHLKKLVIECKWYADFPYHSFVLNNEIKLLDSWLSDLEHDCDPGDLGVLCVKINRKGWFIAVKSDHNFATGNSATYNGYDVCELHKFLKDNKTRLIFLGSGGTVNLALQESS